MLIKENSYLNDKSNLALESFFLQPQLFEIIPQEMDKNKFVNNVAAVLIDFNTINHKILVRKLWCYGFQNQCFEWIESYLHNWSTPTNLTKQFRV